MLDAGQPKHRANVSVDAGEPGRVLSPELRRPRMLANHERVVRMMREDNLLATQTAPVHGHHRFEPSVGGLQRAIAGRQPRPVLVHRYDRGVQYASQRNLETAVQFLPPPRQLAFPGSFRHGAVAPTWTGEKTAPFFSGVDTLAQVGGCSSACWGLPAGNDSGFAG